MMVLPRLLTYAGARTDRARAVAVNSPFLQHAVTRHGRVPGGTHCPQQLLHKLNRCTIKWNAV